MFSWRSKPATQPATKPATQAAQEEERKLPVLADLQHQELVVLFKHSSSCGVSWAAESQVKKFIAQNPDVPVYTILVRQDRELSRQIAEFTRIRHESPQVIVLRRGKVIADASHQDVTVKFLAEATRTH